MATHNITIDVTNPENYYTGLKFKQFDKGNDILKITLKSGTSNFVISSYDALSVRIIRSDGKVFDNIIWRKNDSGSILSGSEINYPIGYFETFCAGSCGLEFSFIAYDANDSSKISKHLTLPRILFDIYASISSHGVIEKRSMDLFQALLEDVKKIQAAVTYEGFEENYEVIKKAVIFENGGELDGETIIGRVQAEKDREEAEKTRAEAERLRDVLENGGEINGQNVEGRNKAEYFREENEGKRILAEIQRNHNEFGELDENGVPKRDENGVPIGRYWAESERQMMEIGRKNAENLRDIAENGGTLDDGTVVKGRVEAEKERAAADEERRSIVKTCEILDVSELDDVRDVGLYKVYHNVDGASKYWLIVGYNDRITSATFQLLIEAGGRISTRYYGSDSSFVDVENPIYSEGWSDWQTIVDESRLDSRLGAMKEAFELADSIRITLWKNKMFYLSGEYVFATLSSGNAAVMEVTAPILVRGSDTPPDALPDFDTNFKIIYTFDEDVIDQSYNANSENAQSGKAVAEAVAKIVNGSPEALDTLYELASALGNDENFSATVMEQIGKKVDKEELNEKVDKEDGYGLVGIRSEVIIDVGQVGSVGEPVESDYRILSVLKGRESSGEAITEDIKVYPAEYSDSKLATKQDLGNAVLEVEKNIETEYATKEEVTTQIGDIETSLENIIDKYGLGGEAV